MGASRRSVFNLSTSVMSAICNHRSARPSGVTCRSRWLIASSAFLFLIGCFARTPYLLKTLNTGSSSSAAPTRLSPAERVAIEVTTLVEDSYFDPKTVAAWMSAAAKTPTPITDQLNCLRAHPVELTPCYTRLALAAPVAWRLPGVPGGSPGLWTPPIVNPALLAEIDVERFVANTQWIASSLLLLEQSLGSALNPQDLQSGVAEGMRRASDYLLARRWQRNSRRPATALVMSGGAATGAFTAGFVWRLMEVLQTCHAAQSEKGCPDSTIDLVVGTSTGTLVGVMVDLFHVSGQEANAKKLLVNNYTCSTEKDLYCQHDDWDWHLAEDLRGLMHFKGIEQKLADTLSPAMLANQTELVTLTVDYDSGYIHAQSDQDPMDVATGAERVQTVLASIVEPVLSDPVDNITRFGKKLPGTYIDAGVRSGLPLLQAVWRGAERTIIISTSSIDIGPTGHPSSALPILMRTLDLATSQNLAAEFQQAEFQGAARRLAEFNICQDRLDAAGVTSSDATSFCERTGLWPPPKGAQAAVANFIGPGLFRQVANTWKSVFIARPENGAQAATGYTFDPMQMRALFEDGVRTFQARCKETLNLLNVPLEVQDAEYACRMTAETAVAQAEKTFSPIDSCHPDDHRIPNCE
jgi:predicted acylesterase/phospholipase RssA